MELSGVAHSISMQWYEDVVAIHLYENTLMALVGDSHSLCIALISPRWLQISVFDLINAGPNFV